MGKLIILSEYKEKKEIEALKTKLSKFIGHITHYESPVFFTSHLDHNIKNILCTLPIKCVK